VKSQSKHLIAALESIVTTLELPEAASRDSKSSAELKRILNQRIHDLQDSDVNPPYIAKPAENREPR